MISLFVCWEQWRILFVSLKFADNIEDGLIATASKHNFDKPRMRICFDPEHEIPKLQSWFAENNHPSRLQVEEYVATLNGLESRKGKKPLDINNVIYWFKNTRAAVKRAQMKNERHLLEPFYLQKLPQMYGGLDRLGKVFKKSYESGGLWDGQIQLFY